ncbi:M1 family metallopeptidase [bacterium]|nr:M1 family metallopeptidase [bacterium]
MESYAPAVRRWIQLWLLCLLALPATATQPWQQEVNYQLDVTLDEPTRSIGGTALIEYINHSPDTLAALWFRLPPAALQAGSYVDRFDFPEDAGRFSRLAPDHFANLTTGEVRVDGEAARFDQDFSIGLLSLDQSLLPGDTAHVVLPFTTRFPTGGASVRIGYIAGQFKGAYWYPMICPYTPQYGWTVNRYFGTGEAYGEFGDFDLRYTVPAGMIVASTGYLVNESEVLPPDRLDALSIHSPSPLDERQGTETWHYRAEQVPDVAFAMDRRFLIDRIDFGHFESWSFVRRENKEKWQGVAELCGWTIQQLEEVYGSYPWPRVMASDSWSAMEYPMLTMMSGSLEGSEYVFIHEVVHNYTPMILHSNSVDVQALDEGFTTFVEHLLTKRWYQSDFNRKRTYSRGLFKERMLVEDHVVRGTEPYLTAVLAGEDLPMVRGGDIAHYYSLLRVSSYYKTPVMLNALRYVVGEETFFAGMRQFYADNKLSHPDELDMVNSFSNGTGQPLGWFFKQFLYSSDDIDYGIRDVQIAPLEQSWQVKGTVVRKAGVRLPVRLGILTTEQDTLFGEISFLSTDPPLDGYQRWGSWDQLHEPLDHYTFSVQMQEGIKPEKVMVDPRGQLADRNPLDNVSKSRPFLIRFDEGLFPKPPPSTKQYEVVISPTLGWNNPWGAFAGVRAKGGFFETVNRFDGELFVVPKQTGESLKGRFWAASPVENLPDGVEATIYTGDLHGDKWLEGGLRVNWRTWGGRTAEHKATLQLGKWYRSSPSSLVPVKSVPYLALEYMEVYPRGRETGSLRARMIAGDAQDAFVVLEFASQQRLRVGKKYFGLIETRLMRATPGTSPRFRPTLSGASSFSVLGDPLAGGPMNPADSKPDTPQIVPAAIAPVVTAQQFPTDRFGVLRFSLERNWARSKARHALGRLPSHLYTGLFGTTAVYGWEKWYRGEYIYRALAEAGLQVELRDFYGVNIGGRIAVARIHLEPYTPLRLAETTEELKQNLQLFISYRFNRFFR